MVRFLFSFSGRLERGPYLLFTLVFSLLILGAILCHPAGRDRPLNLLLSQPWAQLGAALDRVVILQPPLLDLLVSLALALPLLWVWLALTIRRLRALGQSPWWVLVFGVALLPVMWVLALARSATERGGRPEVAQEVSASPAG